MGSPRLTPEQAVRYSRHLLLPEVGPEGQARLREGRVLVVGAGGLGSPAALYLAAAGIGRLGLADFDAVDASNLQRQVLYGTADVGRPKLAAARARLQDLNPDVDLRLHEERLTSGNALEAVSGYDVVLDGTDNFATRYLVNDACALAGKPNVYASIFRFEGQVSVFWAGRGPCYRCLFPEPPPPGMVPSCAEGGVLGVLPGIVGAMQAAEALKLVLGIGEPLLGRLLLLDALDMRVRELAVSADPDCPLCGAHPTVRALIDYDAFCGAAPPEPGDEVAPAELLGALTAPDAPRVLDVRSAQEWSLSHLEGAVHLPLPELPERLGSLDRGADWVVVCAKGIRSARAAAVLREAGFRRVRHLRGGLEALALASP